MHIAWCASLISPKGQISFARLFEHFSIERKLMKVIKQHIEKEKKALLKRVEIP